MQQPHSVAVGVWRGGLERGGRGRGQDNEIIMLITPQCSLGDNAITAGGLGGRANGTPDACQTKSNPYLSKAIGIKHALECYVLPASIYC